MRSAVRMPNPSDQRQHGAKHSKNDGRHNWPEKPAGGGTVVLLRHRDAHYPVREMISTHNGSNSIVLWDRRRWSPGMALASPGTRDRETLSLAYTFHQKKSCRSI